MHCKKRIAQALATAGLVVVLTAGTAFASYGTATVTADALRMRSMANTGSSTVATVYKGAIVELLSEEANGWYKVNYNGKEGYMSAEWLDVLTEDPSDPSGEESAETTEPAASEKTSTSSTAVVSDGPLNVRSGPGTGYDRIGTLNKGTEVTILETLDGWYKIYSGDLTGYVSSQYISTDGNTAQEGLVLSGPLNVRSGPGTGYNRIGSLQAGTTVTVHSSSNGWYQITSGSLSGYVCADYVALMEDLGSSPVGSAAAAMAMSLVGCPYVYGAEGPSSFDCSGLSYYIYKQLGYTLCRGSSSQYKSNGSFVPLSEIEPGDLIFFFDPRFDSSGGTLPTTHMGIYVGNGQFVHASTTSYRVQYDNLYNSYYTPYIVGAKRIS